MGTRSHRAFAQCSKNHSIGCLSTDVRLCSPCPQNTSGTTHGSAVFDDTSWMRPLALLLALVVTPLPQWEWPVAPPHPVVRPFLAPLTPYGVGHRGVDLGAGSTVIRAPADGVVHYAGVVVDRPVLSISHAGGLISSFEPVASTLRKGDVVARGDVIGSLEPGHCASRCVHFGVRLDGEYVSPLLLLGGVPRAVLLPTRSIA